MKVSQEIVDRISKILALANDKAAQPGEVEAALAKAKALAMRHSIDLASIDYTSVSTAGPSRPDITEDGGLKIRSKYEQPYHRYIYHVLEKIFEVRVLIHSHSTNGGRIISRITLIGDPTDIGIAKVIFAWLEKVFPRSLTELVKQRRLTYCAAHTNGFYLGLMSGIIAANKKEEEKLEKEEQQTYAIIVADKRDAVTKYMEENYSHARVRNGRSCTSDWAAQTYGYEKGSSINLRQVER